MAKIDGQNQIMPGSVIASDLANSGVAASTYYADSGHALQLVINSQGLITSAINNLIGSATPLVVAGTAVGQTLRWNGSQYVGVSNLLNDGTNISATGTFTTTGVIQGGGYKSSDGTAGATGSGGGGDTVKNGLITTLGSGGGGGTLSGVSNSDGTLTISPTTGAVVASLNTAHANTWTGVQTFNANPVIGTTTTPMLTIGPGAGTTYMRNEIGVAEYCIQSSNCRYDNPTSSWFFDDNSKSAWLFIFGQGNSDSYKIYYAPANTSSSNPAFTQLSTTSSSGLTLNTQLKIQSGAYGYPAGGGFTFNQFEAGALDYLYVQAAGTNKGAAVVFVPNGTPDIPYDFQFATASVATLLIVGDNSNSKHIISSATADNSGSGAWPLVFRCGNAGWNYQSDTFVLNTDGTATFNCNVFMESGKLTSYGTNYAPPSTTGTGHGYKVQIFPGGTAGTPSTTDYAIGIESYALWFTANQGFKFYNNALTSPMLAITAQDGTHTGGYLTLGAMSAAPGTTTGGQLYYNGTDLIAYGSAGTAVNLTSPTGGGGAVSSVSNSDGSLTITPTTGAVVSSLNLGHANTWTTGQTFSAATVTGTLTAGSLSVSGYSLVPNGTASGQTLRWNGSAYVASSALLNDGTNLTASGTFTATGVIKGGGYQSSDGTAGATATAGDGSTIKNGLTTAVSTAGAIEKAELAKGYTPLATGGDTYEYIVPHSSKDGTTSVTYNVRRVYIRVGVADAGTSTIQIERSTGTGVFTATSMLSAGLTVTGGSVYEAYALQTGTTPTISTTTVNSGDKLRFNFTALDAAHANFTITILLQPT
jgi:hypothetical protein